MKKLPSEVREIINAEDADSSDKVMICSTTIPPTSNTLKKFLVNTSFHSLYIQNECNDRKEDIINIFSAYVEPLIKEINHPVLLQDWKLNLDTSKYERNIDANMYKPSEKKEIKSC